jgi:pimeloyl-ACP methyl ester carboxylesterase
MTPLVLLPGLLCDAAVWAPQMAALGRSCTVVDYGGASSLTRMAEVALAVAPPGRFALAGHSMGGRVALELQRLAPGRIERLALLDTGCQALPPGEAGERERSGRLALLVLAQREGMRAMAGKWARAMLHPSRIGGPVYEAVLEMFERRSPAIFEAQIEALLKRPEATPQLAAIVGPTLLLTGAQDDWSSPAQHRQMQQAIAGARLVVVPDCGHMSTLETPAAVSAALADWLRD